MAAVAPVLRPPIPRRSSWAGPAPLSFAQERLWLLEETFSGSPTYNLPVVVSFSGPVSPSLLEAALNEIVARHEVLRAVFSVRDGEPAQVVLPRLAIRVPLEDLSCLPEAERRAAANRVFHSLLQAPFELAKGPLLRPVLVRFSDAYHVLMVVFHHIVFDGWSVQVFTRELSTECERLSGKPVAPLPDLPIQYADFATWQRKDGSSERLEQLKTYWVQKLTGAPESIDLPTDRRRTAPKSFRGAVQSWRLDAGLADQLRRLAQSENATLFMTVLSCFEALLSQFTRQRDLVVGSPMSGRTREELEPLIGLFVNTVVLRTEVDEREAFRQLLRRVRTTVLDAHAHQDLPFERVVSSLLTRRDPTQNPLFNVMFALQEGQPSPSHGEGTPSPVLADADALASDGWVEPTPSWSKFDMTLTVIDAGRELITVWEYATDIFDHPTITRLGRHFNQLVRSVLLDPDRPVGALELLTPPDRHLSLVECNDTDREVAASLVHEAFDEQAAASPDRVALTAGEAQVTFGGLARQSDLLAKELCALEVGPETRVGVLMRRSPEMVVAVLGVLKAGGAYLPLDPAYPVDRLRFMAEDSGLAAVLTEPALVREAEAIVGSHVPTVVVSERLPGEAPSPREQVPLVADNLAYVLYTSGSTGRPKGVMVSHGALWNHMRWMLDTWPLDEGDAVLQRTPLSFDASVWEIFAPLMAGARLVLGSTEAQGFEWVAGDVTRHGVTVLQVTPTILRALLDDTGGLWRCTTLRRVFCGGEALSSALVDEFYDNQVLPLLNLYGPTEATIDATWWQCQREGRHLVPIGRPISNVHAYVLDEALRPVPLGVSGELYLGGAGLARGYVGQPALTAQRFVPSPFGDRAGARLYRTGDLVRRRRDGVLEFLGRNDDQVKIRGVRIELGDVEAALLAHPDVGACAVVDDQVSAEDRRLCAFLVPVPGEAPSVEALRSFLGRRLPSLMLPATFVVLDRLPMLPNGKVDRRALPTPSGQRPLLAEPYQPPGDELEEQLVAIWRAVLELERVGVLDDFFALGGDSLLASRVVSRIRDTFSVELRLADLFEAPTIRGLRERVEAASKDMAGDIALGEDERRGLLDQIEHLSDAEVEALLSDLGGTII